MKEDRESALDGTRMSIRGASISQYAPLGWRPASASASRRYYISIGALLIIMICSATLWLRHAGARQAVTSTAYRDVLSSLPDRTGRLESLYGMNRFQGRKWLEHIESLDDHGLAPLTKYAQRFIHEWQNPPLEECASNKFLLMSLEGTVDQAHGLGSTVHVMTFQLRNALDTGRILAWADEALGRAYVDEHCMDGLRNFDCLFEPITRCPRSAMTSKNTVTVGPFATPPDYPEGGWGLIPTVFEDALDEALPYAWTGHALKYWWRGQGAAYILRVRRAGLDWLTQSRLREDTHHGWTLGNNGEEPKTFPMPWPLPKGAMSMHVRHGDKGSEMDLVPFEAYVTAGAKLASLNPYAFAKMAFVSSEDPDVFEEAKKIARLSDADTVPNINWVWYASKINRINSGPTKQLESFGNRTETTLSWMAELFIALECDAYVGTRGSNWNRLIDELRCIWTSSCMQPYVEVGRDKDWWGYNW